MNGPIVHTDRPVTLVGGGKVKKSLLNAMIVHAPEVVCADGGARIAVEMGLNPAAVIGDFDSIDAETRAAIAAERLFPIEEQDSTDFEKCLRAIDAPLVLGVGFHGGRADHQLAALHGLMRYPERRCVLVSARDTICLCPPDVTLDLAPGTRLSLFPMGEVGVRSEGLRWPTGEIDFRPGHRIGTSNEVTGRVRLRADAPRMLLILPLPCLPPLIDGLRQPGWPAVPST